MKIMSIINKIINTNYNLRFKLKLAIPILCLVIASLVLLNFSNVDKQDLFYKQLNWVVAGFIIIFITSYLRIDFIFRNSYKLYALLVVLLLVTIFFGIEINYSKRWISLGFITFQPSEIGKILFVFAIAKFLSNNSQKQYGFKTIFVLYFLAGIVFLIIIQQPDLGTSLVYFFCIFPMMYWAGVKLVDILLSISPIISFLISFLYEFGLKTDVLNLDKVYSLTLFSFWIVMLAYFAMKRFKGKYSHYLMVFVIGVNFFITAFTSIFLEKLMMSYWFNRIIAFLDPFTYRHDFAYQINSSYDAIGSGGFFGKGLGSGMLTEFKMMPIYESDFIVSALAEQFGFLGVFCLIFCLAYFFYWYVSYAEKCNNKFEKMILIGFGSIWFFHSFVNLCIVSGIFPVTGLPFPFLSYGGTYFMSNCIMFSIANKIISLHISN